MCGSVRAAIGEITMEVRREPAADLNSIDTGELDTTDTVAGEVMDPLPRRRAVFAGASVEQ